MIPLFTFIMTGLVITSVYPDPLQAENGGEAIQLTNPADTPSSTDGLVLVTKTASYTLPSATVLPGAGYLIADTGWSGAVGLRDNLSWPNADYEISMSLANTDGFVELREPATNTTLDRLSWNSTNKPREGWAWTRIGEAAPFFLNRTMQLITFPVSYAVTRSPPTIIDITVPDEAPQSGTQLLGYTRELPVSATIDNPDGANLTVTARLGTVEAELTTVTNADANGSSTYRGTVSLPALVPGAYDLVVTVESDLPAVTQHQSVTVIPTATITIEPLVLTGTTGTGAAGTIVVHNTGNTRRTITLAQVPAGVACTPHAISIESGASATFACSAPAPPAPPASPTSQAQTSTANATASEGSLIAE